MKLTKTELKEYWDSLKLMSIVAGIIIIYGIFKYLI